MADDLGCERELARAKEQLHIERHEHAEQLRTSEEKFRRIADSLPHLAFTADPDGTPDFINAYFERYTGIPRDTPNAIWLPVHPDDLEPVRALVATALQTGRGIETELRVRRYDGVYHWYLSRVVPVHDEHGRVIKWYGSSTDIDAIKRSEHALLETDRAKDDFLATLSHELRNPLGPIRNSLYLLKAAEPGAPQHERARDVIERQFAILNRLVDDLLDVTRIARRKIELQLHKVDFCSIAKRVVEDLSGVFKEKGVVLTFRQTVDKASVCGDETRLHQVVGNLLQNAVKYTPSGGTTEVELSCDEPGGTVLLRVRDTGVGIDAGTLQRLFLPFQQSERTLDKSRGGLGLGLALVKGLVDMHGGSVTAHSEGPGKGALFEVRIPSYRHWSEKPPTQPAESHPSTSP